MAGHDYKCDYTRAEERELWVRMRAGDADARRRLIESVIPWARNIVNRVAGPFRRPGLDHDDLLQLAVIVIVRCLQTFDPDKGRLSTWVEMPIRHRVLRQITEQTSVVRRCSHRSEKYGDVWDRAGHTIDSPPADNPLFAVGRDDYDQADDLPNFSELRAAVSQLPPRERDVIERRLAGETLDTIGAAIGGVSKERVRQIETRARQTLRGLLAPTR